MVIYFYKLLFIGLVAIAAVKDFVSFSIFYFIMIYNIFFCKRALNKNSKV